MAGFLTALDMYICHPDVTDNTKMFHHVLMWWSEKSVHAVILYRKEKTAMSWGRSFWVHLLGGPSGLPIPMYLFSSLGLGSFQP